MSAFTPGQVLERTGGGHPLEFIRYTAGQSYALVTERFEFGGKLESNTILIPTATLRERVAL